MTKRTKRVPKTKDQLREENKRIEEVQKNKQLVHERIVPALAKHELTIYQVGQVLDILKNVTLGKMNQYWDDKSFAEIGLAEELTGDKEVTDRDVYGDLINSLSDLRVAEVMKLFDVFSRVIEMYGHREVMKAPFSSLPIDEILKV